MEFANPFSITSIMFLMTLVFGFWLSQAGKPYNRILFNIHKFVALGCVVLAGFQFSKMLHTYDWQLLIMLVVSTLCVVVLFVSGALMSAEKLKYSLTLTIHRITSVLLLLLFCVLMLFF
jgi:hypothetical protein